MSMIVKIAGTPTRVSNIAGKIVKNQNISGISKTSNGFTQNFTKFYPNPSATLTESFKSLKDGRTIIQKLWSWPDGATVALTKKTDGFFSYVEKNSSGKITHSIISNNNKHLIEKKLTTKIINDKNIKILQENHINEDKIASFTDGVLWRANKSERDAKYIVQETIKNAEQAFRCIG